MLRRDLGELTELLTVTLWESLAAVRAFAGDDYEYHPVVDTLASAKAQRMNRAAQPSVPSGGVPMCDAATHAARDGHDGELPRKVKRNETSQNGGGYYRAAARCPCSVSVCTSAGGSRARSTGASSS
jgi:hypothetical protein